MSVLMALGSSHAVRYSSHNSLDTSSLTRDGAFHPGGVAAPGTGRPDVLAAGCIALRQRDEAALGRSIGRGGLVALAPVQPVLEVADPLAELAPDLRKPLR